MYIIDKLVYIYQSIIQYILSKMTPGTATQNTVLRYENSPLFMIEEQQPNYQVHTYTDIEDFIILDYI